MSEIVKNIIFPFWRRVFQFQSHCTISSLLQLIIYRNVIFFPSLIPSVWRIFLYSSLMSLLPYIVLFLIFSQNIKFFIHMLKRCLTAFPLYSFITKADYQITVGTVLQNTICLLPFPAADGQVAGVPSALKQIHTLGPGTDLQTASFLLIQKYCYQKRCPSGCMKI